jgi:hypothetical protein
MTRDEFETTLKQARQFGGYGLEPFQWFSGVGQAMFV